MEFILTHGNWLLIPIHVLICLILIAVVLLQTGKGADLAGAFGGAGSQTAFGPRGVENTLSRLTKVAAVMFMVTSFSISLIQSRSRGKTGLPDLPERPQPPVTASPSPAATSAAEPAVTPAPEAIESTETVATPPEALPTTTP